MSVPGIVQSTLDGEEIAARVSLGSEDELFITPTSTLVYRSDGLLRDESVDEYPHEADRITLSEGRRKSKFTLEYPLEDTQEFTVPASKTDAVLRPVLAGVLNGNDITGPGETVIETYRFSELTLIVTSERLVKHIGSAVWDEDYEEYRFDDVTQLSFEDGSVAMQVVLMVDGRPQRIKAPNEEANDLRERLQRALFDYHDVASLEELNEKLDDGESAADDEDAGSTMEFGSGVDPLDADPPEPEDHELEGAATADSAAPADASTADSAVSDSVDARRTQADDERSHARAKNQESSESAPRGTAGSQSQPESEPRRERERDVSESKSEPESDPEPVETGSLFEESADSSSDTTAATDTAAATRSDPLSTGVAETSATESEPEPELESGREREPERDTGSGSQSRPQSQSQAHSQSRSPARSEPDSSADAGAATDPELLERIASLEDAVERQNDLLEQQQRTIDQLIEELRQGR